MDNFSNGKKILVNITVVSFFSNSSCPYFRNEIGGESERRVALTRQKQQSNKTSPPSSSPSGGGAGMHTPAAARGFSLLDSTVSEFHELSLLLSFWT